MIDLLINKQYVKKKITTKSAFCFLQSLLFLGILSVCSLPETYCQKKSYDTLKIKELYNTLIRWQQVNYDNLNPEAAFDTIKQLSASSNSLKKACSSELSKYLKLRAYYNEIRKSSETVDAMTLFSEFSSNKFRAKTKYCYKYANIEGVVVKIDEISGHRFVVLAPSIYCFFSESNSWYIERLSRGESVILHGQIEYYMDNSNPPFVKVNECEGREKPDYKLFEVEQSSDMKIFLDEFLVKTREVLRINTNNDSLKTNITNWDGIYKAENGVLTIKNSNGSNFTYELDVAFMSGSGNISGKAKILKNGSAVHYINDYGAKGQIIFKIKRNRISITEVGSAFNYHGAGATFQLDYYKQD